MSFQLTQIWYTSYLNNWENIYPFIFLNFNDIFQIYAPEKSYMYYKNWMYARITLYRGRKYW